MSFTISTKWNSLDKEFLSSDFMLTTELQHHKVKLHIHFTRLHELVEGL